MSVQHIDVSSTNSATPNAILTGATNQTAATVIFFYNPNGSAVELNISIGASPWDAEKQVVKTTIDPNDTFLFSAEKIVLNNGEQIAAWVNANNVYANVSYLNL